MAGPPRTTARWRPSGSPVRAWMAGHCTLAETRRKTAHPDARGWLVIAQLEQHAVVGSPVRAWMAGPVACSRARLTRLTRARVDGWGAVRAPTLADMAHPCARGWLVVF